MSDDNSQEVKEPLTFADGLQHYFAVRNELYEAKARGDTSEMTTVLEEFFDALRVSLLEAADKAGVADTLRSALYDEQRLERLALWFRKTANNLKATKPGILSLELLGSAGVVVIVVYYVLRVDAWMALLLGFLIIALRLLSPWVVDRIAMHQEKVLRTLRKIDPPQTELRSLYAMPRDYFDPTPEEQNVVLIAAATLREAERLSSRVSTVILTVKKFHSITSLIALPDQIPA